MTEDTKLPTPIRYQQYGITVKLNPDKEDRLHQTFLSLPKTYPTLWVYCVHYDCMQVYDVTNFTDTQRNMHLAEHHILGLKKFHGHKPSNSNTPSVPFSIALCSQWCISMLISGQTKSTTKRLMRKVLQERKTPAQSEELSSGVRDEQSSGKKSKRQAT